MKFQVGITHRLVVSPFPPVFEPFSEPHLNSSLQPEIETMLFLCLAISHTRKPDMLIWCVVRLMDPTSSLKTYATEKAAHSETI